MIIAYIGKMRSGKTLAMTQEVVRRLNKGGVVYVNYKINWNPDAPMSRTRLFFHRLGFKKRRYPKSNLRIFKDWEDVANISNCTVALDEGWQYFDSYQKLPIDKRMRLYQSGKWELDFLYTVQRYMMTDINLRWSTDEFYESTLYKIPFLKYPLIIYRLYDLDEDGESAKLARKGINEKGEVVDLALSTKWFFTRKKHFDVYDTKEDIYATQQYRRTLSEKIDARSADSSGYFDPTPTIWDIIRKQLKRDVRRPTSAKGNDKLPHQQNVGFSRGAEGVVRGQPQVVVARVPGRNPAIGRSVANRGFFYQSNVAEDIVTDIKKRDVVTPSIPWKKIKVN